MDIIGDGPERQNLEAQAEALKKCIAFLGYLPPEALGQAIAGTPAIVVPSLGRGSVRGRGCGKHAEGRVPIVSNLGSLAEVVDDAG